MAYVRLVEEQVNEPWILPFVLLDPGTGVDEGAQLAVGLYQDLPWTGVRSPVAGESLESCGHGSKPLYCLQAPAWPCSPITPDHQIPSDGESWCCSWAWTQHCRLG